jgi:Ca2+-binding EF-hand superfamily protein
MDRNGDKSLSLEELSSGLADMGVPLSASEVRAFMKALDTNGDGRNRMVFP